MSGLSHSPLLDPVLDIDCSYGHNGAVGHLSLQVTSGEIVAVTGPNGAGAGTFLVDPSFFPDLTIGEHLEMTAHQVGVPADELRDSVAPWQISDIESELPSRVSGGQRQCAYLALQLASAANVVVLDEPERHLDGDWGRRLGDELLAVRARGAAVVVATHSAHLAGRADRIVEL